MKYIKCFNEELSPSVYRQAAAKLSSEHGHINRASKLQNWATSLEEKEFKKRLEENRSLMSSEVFQGTLIFESYDYAEGYSKDIYIRGNFHVEVYLEDYWMYSNISNFIKEDGTFEHIIPLMFELSVLSADDDTQSQIDRHFEEGEWSLFVGRLEFGFINFDSRTGKICFNPNNSFAFDHSSDNAFYFKDRVNSVKFRKYFINKVNTNEIKNSISKIIEELEKKNVNVGDNPLDRVLNSIRQMSLNVLYREQ